MEHANIILLLKKNLEKEIDCMKSKYADEEYSFKGRWTKEEHRKFLIALFLFGKDWTRFNSYILTRSHV